MTFPSDMNDAFGDWLKAVPPSPSDLATRVLAETAAMPQHPHRRWPFGRSATLPATRRQIPIPTGRFQIMLDATKVVAAGAIVALFGGALLTTGVLDPRSSDPLPAAVGTSAAASPSDSTQAEPSEAASDTPATSLGSNLLPGVDLEVDEVSPGVFHVIGDGTGHRLTGMRIDGPVVTDDGQLWLQTQEFKWTAQGEKNPRFTPGSGPVFRLGIPGRRLGGNLRLDSEGRPRMDQVTFIDGKWMQMGNPVAPFEDQADRSALKALAADGARWLIRPSEEGSDLVVRKTADETIEYTFDDLGIELPPAATPDGSTGVLLPISVVASPSGVVWVHWASLTPGAVRFAREGFSQMAVTEFDGDGWTLIREEAWLDEDLRDSHIAKEALDAEEAGCCSVVVDVAATGDGTLWLQTVGHRYMEITVGELSRWDGDGWTVAATTPGVGKRLIWWGLDRLRTSPDGTVWLDDLTYLDGDTPMRYRVPSAPSAHKSEAIHMADGSIWFSLNLSDNKRPASGLYVIRPDLADAEPLTPQ